MSLKLNEKKNDFMKYFFKYLCSISISQNILILNMFKKLNCDRRKQFVILFIYDLELNLKLEGPYSIRIDIKIKEFEFLQFLNFQLKKKTAGKFAGYDIRKSVGKSAANVDITW